MSTTNHWMFCNTDLAEPEEIELAVGTVSYFAATSPDKTTSNEDSMAIIDLGRQSCLLCVADGAGGYRNGDTASRLAIETFVEYITVSAKLPIRDGVMRGFELAQTAVVKYANGGGTTLLVAECTSAGVTTFFVGDSCLCIAGGHGRTKSVTVAQSPTGYAVNDGGLDPDQALHHPERHLVSGLLGLESTDVDIWQSQPLSPRDTVVVASDGLYDNLYVREITQLASTRPQLAATRQLVNTCLERMSETQSKAPSKPDDLALLMFRPKMEDRD